MKKTVRAIYTPKDEQGDFSFGNINSSFGASERYFTCDNKAWFPIIGEFHFSRYERENWKKELAKMVAEGLSGVAVYVFWNHHERKCGKFDFTANNDIKHFLSLCKRLKLKVVLRIGPWCHGEVRLGGFPDYLRLVAGKRRSTPLYLYYVKRYWKELYWQVQDFCDGNTVIGIQLENEYQFSISHIVDLRKIAEEIGFKTPFFTMTAWPTNTPSRYFVPMFGGYPEAPWTQHKRKLKPERRFAISQGRSEAEIGEDFIRKQKKSADFSAFPYAGCEVGTGNQVTAHRRPIISDKDGYGVAFAKLASGMNWLGYYMYHGGRNPEGKAMQESRRTFYPNNYPIIDYDFQAPISKDGFVRKHGDRLRLLHLFLNTWDETFARKEAFFATEKEMPYFSLRADETSGYVFLSNYERGKETNDTKLDVDLALGDKNILIEQLSILKDTMYFFPVWCNIGGIEFDYIIAQPILILKKADGLHAYFMRTSHEIRWSQKGKPTIFFEDCIEMEGESGKVILHFLDERNALQLHLYQQTLFFTEGTLYEKNEKLLVELYEGQKLLKEGKCMESFPCENTCEKITLEKIPPMHFRYDSFFYSKGKRSYYRMIVDKELLSWEGDVEITVRIAALNVQIFHDGVLIDDYFNTDKKCIFRLGRLKERLLKNNVLILKTCAKTESGSGSPYLEIKIENGCTDIAVGSVKKIKLVEVKS